jgi:hypothetical protein
MRRKRIQNGTSAAAQFHCHTPPPAAMAAKRAR